MINYVIMMAIYTESYVKIKQFLEYSEDRSIIILAAIERVWSKLNPQD